jgi:hypothetical protein
MNPIPTTNAMKPAPGKGVSSFPTPVIKDTVIVEVVNAWKGDYQPLEYGTKWGDIPHASVQGSFPDHKLISQAPNSEDGQFVKRIWANDRVDQDTYNYAIKYSGGSDQHPIYIRTYILPREGYAPVPDLTPDPLFPNAVLVDEEVNRTEGELDSRYLQVTRVYETLPGPVIPTQRYNERGDLETVNTQTVAPNTAPDPDGLLVTQSQVVQEEVSKGVKTTATVPSHSQLLIKEKKEGLLGETVTTDNIVAPDTQPDELSTTVVASVVQQTSATKAVKRTTTATGPTSLTGTQNKDGLLGKTSVTESIVPVGTQPDPLTFNTLSSEVVPIDSAKAKKTTVVHNGPTVLGEATLTDSPAGLIDAFGQTSIEQTSNVFGGLKVLKNSAQRIDDSKFKRELLQVASWPELFGVEYDETLGVPIEYTEKVVDPNEYKNLPSWQDNSNKNYKPIDKWKTMRRTYNKDKIVAAHLEQFYQVESPVKVELPDKLLSVIVYISGQNGAGKETGRSDSVSGTQYEYSISSSYTGSSSRALDVYFKVESGYSGYIEGYKNIFFAPIESDGTLKYSVLEYLNQRDAGSGQIIKKWPIIKRISENIVLFGGSNSGSVSDSESKSASINGSAEATRESKSFSVSSTANSVQVPTTIHGDIPVQISRDSTTFEQSFFVNSLAYPAKLSATPIPIFPTGIYLIDSSVELYKWGMVKITAITVNITEEYT